MKENDIKSIWVNAHRTNQFVMESPYAIKKLMQKSHSGIILKIMKEFKIRIYIYSISLITILGITLYAFVFLKIRFPLSGILPFVAGSLFLTFKLISEIMRFNFFKGQDDNNSIKNSTINYKTRLKRIKLFDFYIILVLCYGIASLFTFGYLLNIGRIKVFFQSSELLGLLISFIILLLIIPWLMKFSVNKRYIQHDISLKSTMDYLDDKVS